LRRLGGALVLGLLGALGGCRALPTISEGQCGNGVVEAGEDCDTFGLDAFECKAAGELGACHFDCTPSSNGVRGMCPVGFGCAVDHVCRRATGTFEALASPAPGAFEALLGGDFDGDGRMDVVGVEPPGSFGLAHFSVNYFDDAGRPESQWSITELLQKPVLFDAGSADSRSDLVASAYALGILLGEPDQTLSPDVRPSFFLPNTAVRLFSVFDKDVDGTSGLIALTEIDGSMAIARPPTDQPTTRQDLLTKLGEIPGTIDTLAGNPATGHLFDDDAHPCDELVIATLGAREVSSYQGCERDPASGVVHFRGEPLVTTLSLPSPARVSGPVLLADLDGDGHLDVLVNSDQGPHAAFGDGQDVGLLEPYALDSADTGEPVVSSPFAAGDFTGDGLADFVDAEGLLLSERPRGQPGVLYHRGEASADAPWTEARIGDFTGDGRTDVVVSSGKRPDLRVFAGTGTDRPNTLEIPTTRPAQALSVGDFDGDQIADIAFVERRAGPAGEDDFLVAFGGAFTTLASPVLTGHLGGVLQITASADNLNDRRYDMFVTHDFVDDHGESGSAVSLVEGNGRRTFLAPIQLTTVSPQGALEAGRSLAVVTGRFQDRGQVDALALALGSPPDPDAPFELWLLPNLERRNATMQNLGWALDERLVPLLPDQETEVRVALASGDLDGDGIDELLVTGPSKDGSSCLIAPVALDKDLSLVARDPILLDEHCVLDPTLEVADVDGDGASDIILFSGDVREAGRIQVLWNDGAGGFDPEQAYTVVPEDALPRAFTLYAAGGDARPRLAYVSETSARLLEARGKERRFADLGEVATLTAGTGITAGDVNGDGVIDLAVADAGNIRLLQASLVSR